VEVTIISSHKPAQDAREKEKLSAECAEFVEDK